MITFAEALKKSQEMGIEGVTIRGSYFWNETFFSWKGLKHSINVREKFFDGYIPRIETQKLVIGPSVYEGQDGIRILPDSVGLWHK